jgi:tRNA(fMet)-specific endonuclease VapC
MARFLLDTNVLSEPISKQPDPRILRRLQQHEGQCVTAAPVLHELWFGVGALAPSSRREALEAYLRDVVESVYPILPYDANAARWHASERARLQAEGRTPSFVDGVIASIARVNGLTVVTANVRHFRPFADLDVLSWS